MKRLDGKECQKSSNDPLLAKCRGGGAGEGDPLSICAEALDRS